MRRTDEAGGTDASAYTTLAQLLQSMWMRAQLAESLSSQRIAITRDIALYY